MAKNGINKTQQSRMEDYGKGSAPKAGSTERSSKGRVANGQRRTSDKVAPARRAAQRKARQKADQKRAAVWIALALVFIGVLVFVATRVHRCSDAKDAVIIAGSEADKREETENTNVSQPGNEDEIVAPDPAPDAPFAEGEGGAEPEPMVTVRDEQMPGILDLYEGFQVRGILESTIPIHSVTAEIVDLRTLETVRRVTERFAQDSAPLTYDLENMSELMQLDRLAVGEKNLRVWVEDRVGSSVVLERDFYIRGQCGELANITGICSFTTPHKQAAYLMDNDYSTVCKLASSTEKVTVTIPDGHSAGMLTLSWRRAPSSFDVVLMDADETVLSTIKETNPTRMISFYYELDASVKKLKITSPDTSCGGICELRVMEEGRISPLTQCWQPIEGKVDLMVISTHQDDEMLFFGGTIPYYVAQGKNVVVVYMVNCSRTRYAEAMDGLWACGLRNHPIFVGFEDQSTTYEKSVELWGKEKTRKTLVELIRRYQPDVIVTHDVNGEYGHNQHRVTSAAVREAVELAGNPNSCSDSAKAYGTWDVKKLYIHLYDQNQIMMNVYDQPMEALKGLTPVEVATMGYDKHVSQVKIGRYTMEETGKKYDNRCYGLYYSAVGEDIKKDDFFENIP